MIDSGVAATIKWECVHFGTLVEGREEIKRCKELGFSTIQVDVSGVTDEYALFAKIASAMSFPDYFGMNWNALVDCLRDLSWLSPKGVLVVLENSRDLWSQPILAGSLIEVWLLCAEFWAEHKIPFHLAFALD